MSNEKRAEELVAHLKLNNGHAIHGLEYESGGLKYESICDGTDCDRVFCSHPHDVRHTKEILDTVEREAREAALKETEKAIRRLETAGEWGTIRRADAVEAIRALGGSHD